MELPVIGQDRWYEVDKKADGISLIHEPWIKPFFRCNIWHVRGRERDVLVDTGLGIVSVPTVRNRRQPGQSATPHFTQSRSERRKSSIPLSD